MKSKLVLLLLFCLYIPLYGQLTDIDSLNKKLAEEGITDSTRIELLCQLSEYYYRNDNEKGIDYGLQALKYAQNLGSPLLSNKVHNALALNYTTGSIYDKALEHAMLAYDFAKTVNDVDVLALTLKNMSFTYHYQGKYSESLKYSQDALALLRPKGGNDLLINTLYTHVGEGHRELKNYDKALEAYQKGILISKKNNFTEQLAMHKHNMGCAYNDMGEHLKAISLLNESYKLFESINFNYAFSEHYRQKGVAYKSLGEEELAQQAFLKALEEAKVIRSRGYEKQALYSLFQHYQSIGEFEKSLNYHIAVKDLENELLNENNERHLALLRVQHGLEQKEKALSLQESEIEKQRIYQWSLLGAVTSLFIIILVLFVSYKLKSKSNKQLSEQKELLHAQTQELQTQAEELNQLNEEIQTQRDFLEKNNINLEASNKKMLDSLQAGKIIQQALLPNKVEFRALFKDSFSIYKPKDVVSGDFYWTSKHDNRTYLAVFDCTGHGVPGAFLTLLGYSMLNQIVNIEKESKPSLILEALHRKMSKALLEGGNTNKDAGMDIGLACFETKDEDNVQVTYASAKRPLYYIHNLALEKVKGTAKSIGQEKQDDVRFEDFELNLHHGDMLYFTTDGYVDAPSEDRKRFGTPRFENVLSEIHLSTLKEQKSVLKELLERHMKDESLRDDITVLGIRI
ncbi:SpoIIE family protein phosphatase [Sediminitomix flava]|uniref:Serine phosphatase RsbU (Regulator of sigma subunit) n=1 Tax=Sediminitomix flava TaxID=379075 RepID=A0A315ZH53_SEDFL|nr:SpoIIE family protein phosphatase [Sediminitomix flava]PWJ44509.1 serine phosphatase RsbU (regulator of sigma subunit) [Sediminitomix flava]